MNIETIITSRRINYLYDLLKQKETSVLYQFFIAQWKYPASKNEWTEQVKQDPADFGITVDFSKMRNKSKNLRMKLKERPDNMLSALSWKRRNPTQNWTPYFKKN